MVYADLIKFQSDKNEFQAERVSYLGYEILSILVETRVLFLGNLVQLKVVLQPVVAVRVEVIGKHSATNKQTE